jgi:hypothetical protein
MRFFAALLLIASLISVSLAQSKADNFLTQHHIESIAILPPVGESVPASVRASAGTSLISEYKKTIPSLKVFTPDDSTAILEKADRLDDFTSFLNLFTKTGTINRQPLARIGEALGADAILLIDVQYYEAQNGSWMRGRNGHNSARIQYTLFTADGEKVWQHLVVYTHTPTFTAKADKAETVVERLSRRAVSALLRGIQNDDPKKDVEVP